MEAVAQQPPRLRDTFGIHESAIGPAPPPKPPFCPSLGTPDRPKAAVGLLALCARMPSVHEYLDMNPIALARGSPSIHVMFRLSVGVQASLVKKRFGPPGQDRGESVFLAALTTIHPSYKRQSQRGRIFNNSVHRHQHLFHLSSKTLATPANMYHAWVTFSYWTCSELRWSCATLLDHRSCL